MFRRRLKSAIVVVVLLILATAISVTIALQFNEQGSKQNSVDHRLNLQNNPSLIRAKAYHVRGDGKTDDTEEIRKAIDAAAAVQGTVYFGKGVYIVSSPIAIPESVSIVGAGKTQTTFKSINKQIDNVFSLRGNQTIQDIGFDSKIGIWPMGDDITVNSCKFKSSVQGIQNASTIHNLTVMNSIFENCGYGILSNQQPSYDVKIINCQFRHNSGDDIEINAPSERWLIENCVFRDNTSKTKNAGFAVGAAIRAKQIVVKGCTFEKIAGQGVHAEDHADVVIINSTFRNNGYIDYPGSPEADIAVLSQAKVIVEHCVFLKSDEEYSNLAIYNTDLPVGGTLTVRSSIFHNKKVNQPFESEGNKFLN
jgi:hypothetical protein